MVNLSSFRVMTDQEKAYYSSLGGLKGESRYYTTNKNAEIRRQMEILSPSSSSGDVNAQVAVMNRLSYASWLAVFRSGGWEGEHPYPYPPLQALVPPPAAAPPHRPPVAHRPAQLYHAPPPPPGYYYPVLPPYIVDNLGHVGYRVGYHVQQQQQHQYQQAVAGPSRHAAVAPPPRSTVSGARPPSPSSLAARLPPNHARHTIREGRTVYLPAPPVQNPTGAFKAKLNEFYQKPQLKRDEEGRCELLITRTSLFEHGLNALTTNPPEKLRKLVIVKFHGEAGDDAGGLSKEFFHLLSQELFSPDYGLFRTHETYLTDINPLSKVIDDDWSQHYRLFGRCVALSIFHHRLIDVRFTRHFYKSMLSQQLTLDDLKAHDQALWQSLDWMLKNSIEGVLDETFSYEEEEWGELVTIPLVPSGESVPVTDLNKASYVSALVKKKLAGRMQDQLDAFNRGIDDIFPRALLRVFTPSELESLIAGTKDIDVEDWRANTELEGYTAASPQVIWFWAVIKALSSDDRSKFLQWVTGSSRVPTTGFSELRGGGEARKFKITRVGAANALPACHTCFNRLDLPPYPSLDVLKQKLTLALHESDGFSVA